MNINAKMPHHAVLLIRIEVHDVLDTGELSGHIVGANELVQYGLKPTMTKLIKGQDKDDCLRKLKAYIDGENT